MMFMSRGQAQNSNQQTNRVISPHNINNSRSRSDSAEDTDTTSEDGQQQRPRVRSALRDRIAFLQTGQAVTGTPTPTRGGGSPTATGGGGPRGTPTSSSNNVNPNGPTQNVVGRPIPAALTNDGAINRNMISPGAKDPSVIRIHPTDNGKHKCHPLFRTFYDARVSYVENFENLERGRDPAFGIFQSLEHYENTFINPSNDILKQYSCRTERSPWSWCVCGMLLLGLSLVFLFWIYALPRVECLADGAVECSSGKTLSESLSEAAGNGKKCCAYYCCDIQKIPVDDVGDDYEVGGVEPVGWKYSYPFTNLRDDDQGTGTGVMSNGNVNTTTANTDQQKCELEPEPPPQVTTLPWESNARELSCRCTKSKTNPLCGTIKVDNGNSNSSSDGSPSTPSTIPLARYHPRRAWPLTIGIIIFILASAIPIMCSFACRDYRDQALKKRIKQIALRERWMVETSVIGRDMDVVSPGGVGNSSGGGGTVSSSSVISPGGRADTTGASGSGVRSPKKNSRQSTSHSTSSTSDRSRSGSGNQVVEVLPPPLGGPIRSIEVYRGMIRLEFFVENAEAGEGGGGRYSAYGSGNGRNGGGVGRSSREALGKETSSTSEESR